MSELIIPENLFTATAARFGCEVAVIKAVTQVESKGSGFLPDGRPQILFEGHIFYKELKKRGIDPQSYVGTHPHIVYKSWDRSKYKGGVAEYDRLNDAEAIDETAALMSASWGAFQIMGFNYSNCGWSTVKSFVDAMYASIDNHFLAFMQFCKRLDLVRYLQDKNWTAFAKQYNGPGQVEKYSLLLARAYDRAEDY